MSPAGRRRVLPLTAPTRSHLSYLRKPDNAEMVRNDDTVTAYLIDSLLNLRDHLSRLNTTIMSALLLKNYPRWIDGNRKRSMKQLWPNDRGTYYLLHLL